MSKNKALVQIQTTLRSLKNHRKILETSKIEIKKKKRAVERELNQRELCLDLYLVEKNAYDGSIKSNYQRMIEGKKGKFNRFFESHEDWRA